MRVRTFTGGGFAENGYLAVCNTTHAAVVVDPGAAAGRMMEAVQAEGADLQAVLLTHAHLDHVEGVHRVREAVPDVPIWLHALDRPLYDAVQQQAAAFGLSVAEQPDPDHELVEGEPYSFGECTFDVRFAPGHAPGHVIFVSEDAGLALVGDVVFQGSIGRTDLPGGDLATLMRSIDSQILTLPDDVRLLPGHGPETTVGRERASNPFILGILGA